MIFRYLISCEIIGKGFLFYINRVFRLYWLLEPKPLTLVQIWWHNIHGEFYKLPVTFLFALDILVSEIIVAFCGHVPHRRNIGFFSFDHGPSLWTLKRPWIINMAYGKSQIHDCL